MVCSPERPKFLIGFTVNIHYNPRQVLIRIRGEKMQFLKTILLGLSVCCLAGGALADDKNGCTEFGVQLVNRTNSECLLLNYTMTSGYLININPNGSVIYPNMSQSFLTQQGFVGGPTLRATYSCGGKNIIIESHQNYCYMLAGDISGNVTAKDNGISARHLESEGSYFWSYPGHIYWTIENGN